LEQIRKICQRIKDTGGKIIATRTNKKIYKLIKSIIPEAVFFEDVGIVAEVFMEKKESAKYILIVSGGSADIPIAEEAGVMAELMGNRIERLYDVGVAGIHRLLTT